jgi:hypothetical protein
VYFQVREQQSLLWKPHNKTFILWSFFAINANLLVDMLNPQMLKCIICQFRQTSRNILNHLALLLKKVSSSMEKIMALLL